MMPSTVLGTWSALDKEVLIDFLIDWPTLECQALALWCVELYTFSQGKKQKTKKTVTLLRSFLSINTIVPLICLKILALSPHQLIQNLCIEEFIYSLMLGNVIEKM